ncbi:SMI1/KNR4 family protein [Desulfonema limicola]|uniref:SMI1/KNR4 family protein n=1 Tax=Desulfonema limicola TaxID=45656 RepID=UPI001A9A96DE|nr:SMI1/KNR4 family protein [Desulfonema limicola]
MTVQLKKGINICEKEIIGLEQRLGIRFPSDYRYFLIENNGGTPETNEFDIPGLNCSSGITEFFSIDKIVSNKKILNDRLLTNAWPIAYAEGGNYLCLVIGKKAGIYFWDHELESEDSQGASWDNMFFISANFTSFLTSMRKFDISTIKLKPGQVQKIKVNPDFKPEF